MKNIVLSVFFAILFVACVAKEAKKKKIETKQTEAACCSSSDETSTLAISADE